VGSCAARRVASLGGGGGRGSRSCGKFAARVLVPQPRLGSARLGRHRHGGSYG